MQKMVNANDYIEQTDFVCIASNHSIHEAQPENEKGAKTTKQPKDWNLKRVCSIERTKHIYVTGVKRLAIECKSENKREK